MDAACAIHFTGFGAEIGSSRRCPWQTALPMANIDGTKKLATESPAELHPEHVSVYCSLTI
jgi:hypothetical protein